MAEVGKIIDENKKYKTIAGHDVIIDHFSGDPNMSHPICGRIVGLYPKVNLTKANWTEDGFGKASKEPTRLDLVEAV